MHEVSEMAADLSKLNPEFKDKVEKLLARCRQHGVEMRPNAGLRDPFEQGRLWRQSRSIEEIKKMIDTLEKQGAPFLAECIRSAGPQHGTHVTDALPGFSWHQWGEALDCFWVINGAAEWSTKKMVNGINGYHVYADQAEVVRLTAGGHWKSLKDWAHVQLRGDGVHKIISLPQINDAMRRKFA